MSSRKWRGRTASTCSTSRTGSFWRALGFMPLCPFAKSERYEIAEMRGVWEADPEDEIKNSYASATGSIVVANAGILTP